MKKAVRIGAGILLAILFLAGLGGLAWQGYRAAENEIAHENARELTELPDTLPPLQEMPELPSQAPAAEPQETPELIFKDDFASTLLEMDLTALQAVNDDVVGWISIPGTPVSYPLLHGEDNSYYLNHTWEKEYNPGGSIFLECKNRSDLNNFNSIVFGHRMADSSMFNSLQHYSRQSYLEEHPRIYVVTEEGVRVYDIFAAMEVTVTDPVYWLITTQEKYKEPMIRFCLENSVVESDITPTAKDRFITLSTCTGLTVSNDRWVVVAVERAIVERPQPENHRSAELTGSL